MSTRIDEGVNITETGGETNSSTGHEPPDVSSASSSLSSPITTLRGC